jgi:hypothetical protein
MKEQYLIPSTEVIKIEMDAQLLAISGPGLSESPGTTPPGTKPQMPGRPIYF